MAECLVWIQAIVVRFRVIPVLPLHVLRLSGLVGSYFNGRMPGSDPGDRGSIPRDPPSFLLFVFSGLVGPCINGTFMGLSIGHFFYGRIVDFESRNVGSIRTGTLPCSSLL